MMLIYWQQLAGYVSQTLQASLRNTTAHHSKITPFALSRC